MHTETPLHYQLIGSERTDEIARLVPAWRELVNANRQHYSQYQSPEWWEHLQSTGQGRALSLLCVHQGNSLVGIVPLLRRVAAIDVLPGIGARARKHFPVLEVLGSQPLVPADDGVVARMFDTLFAQAPEADAIYFKSLSDGSGWDQRIVHAAKQSTDTFAHISREETFHYLTLPETFELFLQRFGKKKRYNLKRQLRLMEEAYAGHLRFESVTQEQQVDTFLKACDEVAGNSWKQQSMTRALAVTSENREKYADLARRGLLRSYLIWNADRPVAYALGYLYGETYHYSDIAYAESELRLSPGAVLLFLIIRDLIDHKLARQLNFGISDADYKRQFADQHTRDRTVYVFRATLPNRLVCALHTLGKRLGGMVKKLIRGSPGEPGTVKSEASPAG